MTVISDTLRVSELTGEEGATVQSTGDFGDQEENLYRPQADRNKPDF